MLASTTWAPTARSVGGSTALTVALVPTGMKQGVSTSPCGVRRRPARARPLVLRARTPKAPARRHDGRLCPAPGQHGVAETVEPVAPGDRVGVDAPGLLDPAEGHDQGQQARARQMEVGDQAVDRGEPVARRDEQAGATLTSRHRRRPPPRPAPPPCRRRPRAAAAAPGAELLEQPHHGRAHGHDAAARGAGRRDPRHDGAIDDERLLVQRVVLEARGRHRLEGRQADVQREVLDGDPGGAQRPVERRA